MQAPVITLLKEGVFSNSVLRHLWKTPNNNGTYFLKGWWKKDSNGGRERLDFICQTAFKAQHWAKQKLEKTFSPFVEIMCHGIINNTQLFCVISLRKKSSSHQRKDKYQLKLSLPFIYSWIYFKSLLFLSKKFTDARLLNSELIALLQQISDFLNPQQNFLINFEKSWQN